MTEACGAAGTFKTQNVCLSEVGTDLDLLSVHPLLESALSLLPLVT